jgi:hypothetical protein
MPRYLRIGILLFVLASVAQTAWLARSRTTEWKYSVRVAIYPIPGDSSPVTADYVRQLRVETLQPIALFMKTEAQRHGLALEAPVDMYLAPPLTVSPPAPPVGGNVASIMLWSLNLRFWAWRHDNFKRPKPDVRLFVNFFDPARSSRLGHSTGLQKGHIGVVNAFAHADQEGPNNVVITHELLHTLGATDKYDFPNNQPRHPDGFAEPDATPLLPQRKAEIMAGRIPLSQSEAEIPASLKACVIGSLTAREINWLR